MRRSVQIQEGRPGAGRSRPWLRLPPRVPAMKARRSGITAGLGLHPTQGKWESPSCRSVMSQGAATLGAVWPRGGTGQGQARRETGPAPLSVGGADRVPGWARALVPACFSPSEPESNGPKSTRRRPATRGSRERWSFASGSPQTDRSRRWRSCARPDPGSWTRPRRKRSAAPARILSSEAGSVCPSPIASISRITYHCQPPASKQILAFKRNPQVPDGTCVRFRRGPGLMRPAGVNAAKLLVPCSSLAYNPAVAWRAAVKERLSPCQHLTCDAAIRPDQSLHGLARAACRAHRPSGARGLKAANLFRRTIARADSGVAGVRGNGTSSTPGATRRGSPSKSGEPTG